VDGDETHDWCTWFHNCSLPDGSGIRVIQASWIEIEMTGYHDSGPLLSIAPVRESENEIKRPQTLTVRPDFVLIRNQVRGPTPESDRRNILYGLMWSNVPSINSLSSEYMNLERPIMFGALTDIKKRVGRDKFPLIDQTFYSSNKQMIIAPEFPLVMKISHAHAGMGKMQVKNSDEFRDLSTIMALHHDYCTAEHFVDADYGIRVQKIGNHYRVFKKIFTGSGWKSQFGGSDLQDVPLTETYKFWADECSKCFGGMDILAVDAMHGNDGNDYIIELNGTAIGLHRQFVEEDSFHVRDLVLERMSALFP